MSIGTRANDARFQVTVGSADRGRRSRTTSHPSARRPQAPHAPLCRLDTVALCLNHRTCSAGVSPRSRSGPATDSSSVPSSANARPLFLVRPCKYRRSHKPVNETSPSAGKWRAGAVRPDKAAGRALRNGDDGTGCGPCGHPATGAIRAPRAREMSRDLIAACMRWRQRALPSPC
jgi:hypothetical protein